jgi:osmotically-inducible protein OsmY
MDKESNIYILKICFIVLITFFLQACMNVATTGVQVVYNHHSIQKSLKDQYLSMQVYDALYMRTKEFANTNIAISVYNKEVLLAGQVPHAWQKKKIDKLVKQIPDIERVYNLLAVQNPSSALTRVSDTWITAKVKAKLIASNDIDATQIKVITENGVVYLMGILPPDQALVAVDVARNTDGVLSVVKIFTYMKISKTLS